MDLYADGGSKIVGVLPGFQHERISLACELFRKALGKSGVALAGAQPAGDVILVPFRQQAGGQDLPEVCAGLTQIGRQKFCDGAVPGVLPQCCFKVVLRLRAEDRVGLRQVLQLYLKQIDVSDDICPVLQIDLIAHIIGRGQRVTDRQGGFSAPNGNGIPFTGDGLVGEIRRLYFEFEDTFIR